MSTIKHSTDQPTSQSYRFVAGVLSSPASLNLTCFITCSLRPTLLYRTTSLKSACSCLNGGQTLCVLVFLFSLCMKTSHPALGAPYSFIGGTTASKCRKFELYRLFHSRRKLAWSRDGNVHGSGTSHATTASPKPSLRASWSVGDAVVGRGNAG